MINSESGPDLGLATRDPDARTCELGAPFPSLSLSLFLSLSLSLSLFFMPFLSGRLVSFYST
jgi:hypothetical protein